MPFLTFLFVALWFGLMIASCIGLMRLFSRTGHTQIWSYFCFLPLLSTVGIVLGFLFRLFPLESELLQFLPMVPFLILFGLVVLVGFKAWPIEGAKS